MASISVAVIEDPAFNAWATRVEDEDDDRYTYVIGLHGGLLSTLNLLIVRMLADPPTFPEVGEPNDLLLVAPSSRDW